jgi:hypothetical protein
MQNGIKRHNAQAFLEGATIPRNAIFTTVRKKLKKYKKPLAFLPFI